MSQSRTIQLAVAGNSEGIRPRIAIIGAGFSGALLAVHLLRSRLPMRIVLFERRPTFARGVAYSTDRLEHLLNVPAGNMSALVGQPGHFLEWLKRHEPNAHAHTFASRTLYGHYLEEVLMQARHDAWLDGGATTLERIQDDVLDVSPVPDGQGYRLNLRSGGARKADFVALATGHQAPSDPLPRGHRLGESDRYLRDPWRPMVPPAPDDTILLVGTGLTTVDVLLTLQAQGHRGKVIALSRHGLMPQAHVPNLIGVSVPPTDTRPQNLAAAVRMVRRQLEREQTSDPERWRSVIDGLRPYTSELWQQLSPVEQKRFMRHVRAFWDVGRHRVAPSIGAMIQAQLESGRLSVAAGRLTAVEETANGVTVTWRPRHTQAQQTLTVQRIINCTGPDTDLRRSTDPLIQSLFAQGLMVTDPLGLGLETTTSGALVDATGRASSRLFTLGPLLRPRLWETIAVPELRVQALALASRLAGALRQLSSAQPADAFEGSETLATNTGSASSPSGLPAPF